jgi:hypothetical protein
MKKLLYLLITIALIGCNNCPKCPPCNPTIITDTILVIMPPLHDTIDCNECLKLYAYDKKQMVDKIVKEGERQLDSIKQKRIDEIPRIIAKMKLESDIQIDKDIARAKVKYKLWCDSVKKSVGIIWISDSDSLKNIIKNRNN